MTGARAGHAGRRWLGRQTARAAGRVVVLASVAAVLTMPAGSPPVGEGTIRMTDDPVLRPGPVLATWGSNIYGQLGNGQTGGSVTSAVQVNMPAGTSLAQVSGGCDGALALTSSGQILAWGGNSNGQLGIGKRGGSYPVPVPVAVPAGVRITQVRTNCKYSLALTSTGRVLAWGDNSVGELGTGQRAEISAVPSWVRLPPRTKVTSVSTGGDFAMALTARGQLFAWGLNDVGQLGTGTHQRSPVPVRVRLPARTKVISVAAGGQYSLALTSKGHLLAWGDNSSGQFGDGTTRSRLRPGRVFLPTGTKLTQISVSGDFSLAITTARQVLSWGRNFRGDLGDGTVSDRRRPVTVRLPRGAKAIAVSAGGGYGLALTTTGRVLAWGSNESGELGDGSARQRVLPVAVWLPAHVTGIAAGEVNGYAILG
ncbi:MAG: cell wall anchor protein [Actinomycetota bacterium]